LYHYLAETFSCWEATYQACCCLVDI